MSDKQWLHMDPRQVPTELAVPATDAGHPVDPPPVFQVPVFLVPASVPPVPVAPPVAQPPRRPRMKVEPAKGSRLEALLMDLREAEGAVDEAQDKLRDLKAGIKAELHHLAGDDPATLPAAFDIPADPRGAWDAYALTWHEPGKVLDGKSMKEHDPATYEKWVKAKSGYWEWRGKN